jgi:hypothetical protein
MKKLFLSVLAIVNTIILFSQEKIVFERIADTIDIQGNSVLTSKLPGQLLVNSQLGLVTV